MKKFLLLLTLVPLFCMGNINPIESNLIALDQNLSSIKRKIKPLPKKPPKKKTKTLLEEIQKFDPATLKQTTPKKIGSFLKKIKLDDEPDYDEAESLRTQLEGSLKTITTKEIVEATKYLEKKYSKEFAEFKKIANPQKQTQKRTEFLKRHENETNRPYTTMLLSLKELIARQEEKNKLLKDQLETFLRIASSKSIKKNRQLLSSLKDIFEKIYETENDEDMEEILKKALH